MLNVEWRMLILNYGARVSAPRTIDNRRTRVCLCGLAGVRCTPSRVQNHSPCHPEREGGGSGGREGSPHNSRCRSTVSAGILRPLPYPRPSLRMTVIRTCPSRPVVSPLRFGAHATKNLSRAQTFARPVSTRPRNAAHAPFNIQHSTLNIQHSAFSRAAT